MGLSVGGPTRSTEEGNNCFLVAEGELIFSPIFEDEDKQRIL